MKMNNDLMETVHINKYYKLQVFYKNSRYVGVIRKCNSVNPIIVKFFKDYLSVQLWINEQKGKFNE